jgi:hypothetical protein
MSLSGELQLWMRCWIRWTIRVLRMMRPFFWDRGFEERLPMGAVTRVLCDHNVVRSCFLELTILEREHHSYVPPIPYPRHSSCSPSLDILWLRCRQGAFGSFAAKTPAMAARTDDEPMLGVLQGYYRTTFQLF